MPPAPVSITTSTSQDKPPRARENLDPPRQVHFAGEGTKIPLVPSNCPKTQNQPSIAHSQPKSSSATPSQLPQQPSQQPAESGSKEVQKQESTQPDSFPGIGHFPGTGQPNLQWHRAAVPGQSLSPGFGAPGSHLPGSHCTFSAQPGLQQHIPQAGLWPFAPQGSQSSSPHPTTYIGRPPPTMTGDYQNTAPPSRGQCYQPPVPDTTFGPMYHVYTPRFDPPGIVPPTPVGHQLPPAHPVPTGQYFLPQQQMYGNQPLMAHPTMIYAQGPQMAQQFQPVPMVQPGGIMGPPGGGLPTVIPMMAGNPGPNVSEVAGIGRTPMEEAVRQHHFAHQNKLFEPQDFKPADDDPSRFYYVREVDGNWTQRNRFTIDNTGDCRWFVTPEGWFYAVRQPD